MSNDMAINMLRDDIKEIKRDVKELIALKWKFIGAMTVISILISFGIEIAFKYQGILH